MSRTYEFLKECGTFYLLTVKGDHPAGRPFGAVMEYEGSLYFATSKNKEVCAQVMANPFVQIVALKPGTRQWIRVDGRAEECRNLAVKRRMLEECPVLLKHFCDESDQNYILLRLTEGKALFCTDAGKEPVD